MIGTIISGQDMNGKQCEGRVMDKVRTITTISLSGRGAALVGQQSPPIPVAVDAYLVLGEKLHLVLPTEIDSVAIDEPAQIEGQWVK